MIVSSLERALGKDVSGGSPHALVAAGRAKNVEQEDSKTGRFEKPSPAPSNPQAHSRLLSSCLPV
jgi:hypothetical protein